MAWSFVFLADRAVLRVTVTGRLTLDAIQRMTPILLEHAERHGTDRILVDHRGAELALSTVEIHFLPDVLKGAGAPHDVHAAIVIAEDNPRREDYRFLEARTTKMGFRRRVFVDYEAALDWLTAGATHGDRP